MGSRRLPVNLGSLKCCMVSTASMRRQPGPGMISAAIVATKALAAFRPRALAMSGICGGRKDETELGALIVPDLSWNYQSGKFVDGKLTADLLQVSVTPSIRASLAQLSSKELSAELRAGLMHSELLGAPIQVQPMVSGSQVVADESMLKLIGDQGRKVAGIDMEVASIYFAGQDFFDGGGIFLPLRPLLIWRTRQKMIAITSTAAPCQRVLS